VDAQGVPVSSNPVWNNCIRNIPTFDDTGKPLSCDRYHAGFVWEHPDLLISFTWNTHLSPPLLLLPAGYVATVMGPDPASQSAANERSDVQAGTAEEPLDASVAASSSSASSGPGDASVAEALTVSEDISP
jgi:hypothetical protein